MEPDCSLLCLQQSAVPFLSQNYPVNASILIPEDPS